VRPPFALGAAASALALIAAGCGSSGSNSAATTATPASGTAAQSTPATTSAGSASPAAATSGATTITTKHAKLGTILAAGPKLMTVYLFEGDKASTSACMGACAQVWPPVTTAGEPTVGGSAMAADLGTITRPDGTKQVTYKGHPLYFFARDGDKGDAYGQGVRGFGADWYVLKPSGVKLDKS
jgi:predicted lipoprotein with Yx(FWY)xxD motif